MKAKYFGASFQGGQTGFHNQAQACLHPKHSSFVPPAVGSLANNQDKVQQDLAAPFTAGTRNKGFADKFETLEITDAKSIL